MSADVVVSQLLTARGFGWTRFASDSTESIAHTHTWTAGRGPYIVLPYYTEPNLGFN